jgi:UTP--glucose-1-phosphate uridylyltransferase/phosphoglucomutase
VLVAARFSLILALLAADFAPFEAKMRAEGLSDAAVAAFAHNYDALANGVTGLLPESEITPVDSLPSLDDLRGKASEAERKALLAQTCVLKLNGGLGTSMGLERAKSLLPVKDGETFLGLIARQVKHQREAFGCPDLRFTLMNSFSTSDDTRAFLAEAHPDLLEEPTIELLQNKSPKVDKATLAPATWSAAPALEWCPPGHGDIYAALAGSGMLESLLASGIRYMFVSNSDNLGATLDLDLLAYFAGEQQPFLMECAQRTSADKKGGHLARRAADGVLLLRESAQCPPADGDAFQDVGRHQFFNTNNLWLNLPALQAKLAACGGALPLPLIKNEKTVDPRDKKSTPVLQLETAMGAAIECFPGAGAVVVPRSRFAPVKTCGDLFLLRSDAYTLTSESTIVLSPGVAAAPLVKLDDAHFKLVDQLDALASAYPSLRECRALTVKGPVRFAQPGGVLKGSVTFSAAGPEPAEVAPGVYEDAEIAL